jgi:hypothetical protein
METPPAYRHQGDYQLHALVVSLRREQSASLVDLPESYPYSSAQRVEAREPYLSGLKPINFTRSYGTTNAMTFRSRSPSGFLNRLPCFLTTLLSIIYDP